MADIAGVSKETYRIGAKVINSNNEDVKQRVLSGETWFVKTGESKFWWKTESNCQWP